MTGPKTRLSKKEVAQEKMKVRADPDYLPPICLECGTEIGKPYIIGIVMGLKLEGKLCVCYDHDDLLCENCMDKALIAEWKAAGLWEED